MVFLSILLGGVQAFLDVSTNNAKHITETELFVISSKGGLEEHSHFENIKINDKSMKLRGDDGSAAFIAFKRENMLDSWSTVIKLKKPVLEETQRASIQLWYTDALLKEGQFMGGDEKFMGFLAGIEFTAKHPSTIFTFNYGFDFKGKENSVIQRDRLNHQIFEGVDEITLKIVHTENNFLIELYNDVTLISDSFRIHQSLLPVEKDMPRYFGLTTSYKNCPDDISLEITELKVMERKEGTDYNSHDAHLSINKSVPTKSMKEVVHAVASLNHFISYVEIAVGKDGASFTDVQTYLKETVRNQRHKLDEMIAHARERKKANDDVIQKDNIKRIDAFALQLNEIHGRLMEYRNILQSVLNERPYNIRNGVNLMFVFVIISGFIFVSGQLLRKYRMRDDFTEKKK
ncbi:hypothetical protein PAEPH01_0862 [Pancytospora epiphaga]|nr:hypothetical protein PAEPH01_0862 [Pancytospora epiphaga]